MDDLIKDEKILNSRIEKLRNKERIYQLIKKTCLLLITLYIVFNYIFGLVKMNGIQMNPKITDGDLILYYRIPKEYNVEDLIITNINNKDYILRIVAIEGQTVDITENGELLIDNHTLEEEIYYKTYKADDSNIIFPYKVEKDKVFLLGDFRTNTEDSRKFGTIEKSKLKGKIISILRNRNL